jgi:hypothetical protein
VPVGVRVHALQCFTDIGNLISELADLLLFHVSQDGDFLLAIRQFVRRQPFAVDAIQAVVLDEAPQQGHLLKPDRLDLQKKLLMQPVDLLGSQFPGRGAFHVDGVEVFRDKVPVSQMNDAARRFLDLHAELNLRDTGQLSQKVHHGEVEVVDPGRRLGAVVGDGLGGLLLLIGHDLLEFGDAVFVLGGRRGAVLALVVQTDGQGDRADQTS